MSIRKKLGPLFFLYWITAGCGSTSTPAPTQVTLSDLRVKSGAITGWQPAASDEFTAFDPTNLDQLINGAAPTYNDAGLKQGFRQKLSGPGQLEIYVMEMKSAAAASAVFSTVKQSVASPQAAGTRSQNEAYVAVYATGTCRGAVHFGAFYFELTLKGMESDTAAGVAELNKFIDYYDKAL